MLDGCDVEGVVVGGSVVVWTMEWIDCKRESEWTEAVAVTVTVEQ